MAARFNQDHHPLRAATEEEVRQALDRVLNSKHFIHAPKKQKFLRLICDYYLNGRAGELNEYLIGQEVFDRNHDYNPSADPIVRVGAHDIRKKLELYYQQEGVQDEIRLEIPVGSYEPNFVRIPELVKTPAQPTQIDPPESKGNGSSELPESHLNNVVASSTSGSDQEFNRLQRRLRWLYTALALLVGATILLALLNFSGRSARPETEAQKFSASLGQVWAPFLKGNEATLLVLSSPPVYRLMNAGDSEFAVKNSVDLPPEKAGLLVQAIKDNFAVRNSPRNPRLVLSLDTYTGLGEAIGAQRVTDLLRTAGRPVTIKRSRTVSADDLKDQNVILFGSVWSNEWSGKLPMMEDFHVTGQATIENHNQRPGEAREYRSRFDESTGRLAEDYALITIKPNISGANFVLVLAGLRSAGTEAAAEFITNKDHLSELNRQLRSLGAKPDQLPYFQALLKVGVENGIPTTISLVALHELK